MVSSQVQAKTIRSRVSLKLPSRWRRFDASRVHSSSSYTRNARKYDPGPRVAAEKRRTETPPMSFVSTLTSARPPLDLPPPYRLVHLRETGDAFEHACRIAAEAGAGTLVRVGRFDLTEFALVLEPEEPLAQARRAFFACMVALADAIGAVG